MSETHAVPRSWRLSIVLDPRILTDPHLSILSTCSCVWLELRKLGKPARDGGASMSTSFLAAAAHRHSHTARAGVHEANVTQPTSAAAAAVLAPAEDELLEFMATCDESGATLTFNDWWHRNSLPCSQEDSFDVCDAVYQRLPPTERMRFVPIRSHADIHRVFGPPPDDAGGFVGTMATEVDEDEAMAIPDVAAAIELQHADRAVDALLRAGAREVSTAAVVAECARAANAVSLEAARAALVKKAKSTSGCQYLRCGGGENSTLMAATGFETEYAFA